MSKQAHTLRHFVQRSAALRLYRDVWRVSRDAGSPEARDAIRAEARREFDADRARMLSDTAVYDSTQVDFLISKGQARLSELRKMLQLSTTSSAPLPSQPIPSQLSSEVSK